MSSTRPSAASTAGARRLLRGGRGLFLASAAVVAICALTVFFMMSIRGHARRSEAQLPHASGETAKSGVDTKTAAVDKRSFPQSQPVTPPQQATATPEDLSPSHPSTLRDLGPAASDRHEGIAKTHAELMALERQGTSSYIEFSVVRSKHFQAIGPMAMQLRRADPKHGYFDLRLKVNGRQLEKKHVNLYEPVWIRLDKHTRPFEFVVNGMSKNQISGYISEPRNRNSRLAQR